jgi:uncharacterized protein
MDIQKYNICFYHHPCSDGMASCWAVNKYCDSVEMIGTKPQFYLDTGRVSLCKDANIICVDVIPSKESLQMLDGHCKTLTILDHHKTNKEVIEELNWKNSQLIKVFDMDRAGCQITWDYFFPLEERPWFIDYIADRDLWKWELPDSKDINTGMFEMKINSVDKFNELFLMKKNDICPEIKRIGEEKIKINTKIIEKCIRMSLYCHLHLPNGDKQLVILGNPPTDLRSEFGNQSLLGEPFYNYEKVKVSASWHLDFYSQEWWISLRSLTPNDDVSAIAKQFGGGGHPCASGFTIKRNDGNDLWDYFSLAQL